MAHLAVGSSLENRLHPFGQILIIDRRVVHLHKGDVGFCSDPLGNLLRCDSGLMSDQFSDTLVIGPNSAFHVYRFRHHIVGLSTVDRPDRDHGGRDGQVGLPADDGLQT